MRVRSEGNLTTPLTFWRAEALWASDHGTYAALGLYFGILAALLLYNGLMFLALRDPLYLLYIAFVATMGLAQLANTGWATSSCGRGRPRWGNDAMMIGMSTTGIFASLFVRRFPGRWRATAARSTARSSARASSSRPPSASRSPFPTGGAPT
ncbi:MAG: hypothetical protein IPL06_18585 [Betaproteobacteria bacterium]|nr:hypothetical protein [Betaproteobacteria bacterium]